MSTEDYVPTRRDYINAYAEILAQDIARILAEKAR